MKFLSLFAGIGGLDLGLERAGWQCVGQVEIDRFATAVLAKHWPAVRRWTDVRTVTADNVMGAVGRPDAIVGGFPCQPWSVAGKQRGADDPRHLWPEYYRLICDLRPRWVVGENVPGLLSTGADAVLADLEAAGYTCWPIVLGADDVGAPHRRKRVFFVARLADAVRARLEGWDVGGKSQVSQPWTDSVWPARPSEPQHPWEEPRAVEPEVGGAADGVSRRLAGWRTGALRGLGNAVVPQVAEVIGRAILDVDNRLSTCEP